jgi:short-subunit dehydrogenase
MNKTIIVTGGTKGIGRAIIFKFAAQGFNIITCARNLANLESLKLELKESFPLISTSVFQADLSQSAEVKSFSDFVKSKTKAIDVLVNNTGVFEPGDLLSEDDGKLELMMNTNLYSAYHLSKNLVPQMVSKKRGDVFNICSVASLKAYPGGGSYSISKFALYGFSQGLREELKPHGIRVTSVIPGATFTASWEGVDLPEDRFIKAEDVADAIWSAHNLSRQTVIEDLVIRPQLGDI